MSSISTPQTPPYQGGFPHFDFEYPHMTLPSWMSSDTDMESSFASYSRRALVSTTKSISLVSTAPTTTNPIDSPVLDSIISSHPIPPASLPDSVDEKVAALPLDAQFQAVNARLERMRRMREALQLAMNRRRRATEMAALSERTLQIQQERSVCVQMIIEKLRRGHGIDEGEGLYVPGRAREIMRRENLIRSYLRRLSQEEERMVDTRRDRDFYLALEGQMMQEIEQIQQEFREAKGVVGDDYSSGLETPSGTPSNASTESDSGVSSPDE